MCLVLPTWLVGVPKRAPEAWGLRAPFQKLCPFLRLRLPWGSRQAMPIRWSRNLDLGEDELEAQNGKARSN